MHSAMPTSPLPLGASLRGLTSRHDPAGSEVQLHCRHWGAGAQPVQWNLVSSRANTLRGVHVHIVQWDYLHVAHGEMLLGLHDMRPWSASHGTSSLVSLTGDAPSAVVIPPGVAHGFYFAAAAQYFYAVSHYWDQTDELGCRWDDPALNLAWPIADPLLSARDRAAGSYRDLAGQLAEARRRGLFAA